MQAVGNKRKADGDADAEYLEITPLGAGNEVGRSCIILRYKGKTIMLDCGIHPAYSGIAALPFFDEVDPKSIDVLLVTHFHLDHAASLPYFLAKTDFRGRVFMTHPTKSVYKLILTDYVKVSTISVEDALYTESDLTASMDRIEGIDFHQTTNVNGIKFRAYNAGHVLGAAMFMIEIAGVKILYTGDYSRQEDRHLMPAEIPEEKPDVLIVESTYGVQTLQPIEFRERRFTSLVHEIIRRGGRCLIPVFALGRAQELMLILDEYWGQHSELQATPIYYASMLAKKCMAVYQRYIHMMSKKISQQFEHSNPFHFKYIMNLRGMSHFDDIGPSVVFASPGMLQSGLSRELFELWSGQRRNGVIVPGYCVEGTLAKSIMSEPNQYEGLDGMQKPLNMSIHYVTFSAHADFAETSEFIDALQPPHIVLVHGEANEMARLKGALQLKIDKEQLDMRVSTPKNCQSVELEFRSEKVARTVGRLAARGSAPGTHVRGVVVRKDFSHMLLAAEDLPSFTPLSSASVAQRLKVPFRQSVACLQELISHLFSVRELDVQEYVSRRREKEEKDEDETAPVAVLKVHDAVTVLVRDELHLELLWNANPVNDMVVDSVMTLVLSVEGRATPGAAKALLSPHGGHCKHEHTHSSAMDTADDSAKEEDGSAKEEKVAVPEEEQDEESPVQPPSAPRDILLSVLREHFGAAHVTAAEGKGGAEEVLVVCGESNARVALGPEGVMTAHSSDEHLKAAIDRILGFLHLAIHPLEPHKQVLVSSGVPAVAATDEDGNDTSAFPSKTQATAPSESASESVRIAIEEI